MTGSNKKTLLIIQIFITMKTNTPKGIKQKGNQLMRMGMEIKQWTLHKVAFLVHCFQVKLEFEMFLPREDGPREKTLKARIRTNNKFNSHVMPCPCRNGNPGHSGGGQVL